MQVRNKIILFLLLSNVVFLSNAQLQESNDDYEKALQSFHQNKFNEAYIHTKNVLKESPNHLPSKILLGKIHIHRNEANAAIDILNEAIDMNAHPNFITVPLANAYKLKKNYDKIIKLSFDKLYKNNEFELIILQANAYKILEKFDLSLNKYNQALTIKTKSIVANTELAYLYIQLGRVQEAESVASLLESIATEQPFTLHIKGLIAQQTNKPDQALNFFEQAYQKDKKSPFIARSLASFYISQQKYDLARKVVDGILIETPDGNLSRGMRQLNGVYTQITNRYHGKVGHVFQGRYKAILVQKESYLLELARYIVLNPVRAKLVKSVQDWPWSSYHQTSGNTKTNEHWVTTKWLLSVFSQELKTSQKQYRAFVAQGENQSSPWESLQNQVFLGCEDYVNRILSEIDQGRDLSEIPKSQRSAKPKELSWYEKQALTRNEVIKLSYESGGYSMKEIGSYYKLHYSRVSRIIKMAKGKT